MNNSIVSPSIVIEAIGVFGEHKDSMGSTLVPTIDPSASCTLAGLTPTRPATSLPMSRSRPVAVRAPVTAPRAAPSSLLRASSPANLSLVCSFLFMPPLYEHLDLKSTDIFIFLFNKTVEFKSTMLDNSCMLRNSF